MRSFGIFEEIERLIEYIPIESEYYVGSLSSNDRIDNAKFAKGTSIDSKFYFNDTDGVATRLGIIEVVRIRNRENSNNYNNTNDNVVDEDNSSYYYATIVSFRDIIKLFNKFLKDGSIEELVTKHHYRYLTQHIRGFDLSSKGILFDFCLAAMECDTLNAKLYLRHALYLLGLHPRLYLLLCVIINESLAQDRDIMEFLTLLAVITEPNNIDIHFNPNHGGFSKRYDMYLKQLQILTPIHKQKISKTTITNSMP
jgi:hypothetical protein